MQKRASEIFFYLGQTSTTHYWCHLAPAGAALPETAELCRQLYHEMIDCGLATTASSCFVFSTSGAEVQPVCVTHVCADETPLELWSGSLVGVFRAALAERAPAATVLVASSPYRARGEWRLRRVPGEEMAPSVRLMQGYSKLVTVTAELWQVVSTEVAP